MGGVLGGLLDLNDLRFAQQATIGGEDGLELGNFPPRNLDAVKRADVLTFVLRIAPTLAITLISVRLYLKYGGTSTANAEPAAADVDATWADADEVAADDADVATGDAAADDVDDDDDFADLLSTCDGDGSCIAIAGRRHPAAAQRGPWRGFFRDESVTCAHDCAPQPPPRVQPPPARATAPAPTWAAGRTTLLSRSWRGCEQTGPVAEGELKA